MQRKEIVWRIVTAPIAFVMAVLMVGIFLAMCPVVLLIEFIEKHCQPRAWKKNTDAAVEWWGDLFFGWIEKDKRQ